MATPASEWTAPRRSASSLLWGGVRVIAQDPMGMGGLVLLVIFALGAVTADMLALAQPFEVMRLQPDQAVARFMKPDGLYWLGTNSQGNDVFSQLIYGSRITLLVGTLSAVGSGLIGTMVGLHAGYFGGKTDRLLMSLVDIAYAIPFLPFALIFVTFAGQSIWNVILVIILLLWRTSARVVRAQVLTLKARPYVLAARSAGASHLRTLYLHVAPNVLPFTFLYMAMAVGEGVLMEASLSFLGFSDPRIATWGQMLQQAFVAGAMRVAWWWVLPPGLALSIFVCAVYAVTRSYEEVINPRLRRH